MKKILTVTALMTSPILADFTARIDQIIPGVNGADPVVATLPISQEDLASGEIDVTSEVVPTGGSAIGNFGSVAGSAVTFELIVTNSLNGEEFFIDDVTIAPVLPVVNVEITTPDTFNAKKDRTVLHTRVDKGYTVETVVTNFNSQAQLDAAREVTYNLSFTEYVVDQHAANSSNSYTEIDVDNLTATGADSTTGTYSVNYQTFLGAASAESLDTSGEVLVNVNSLPIPAGTYGGNVFDNDVSEQSLASETVRVFPIGTGKISGFNFDDLEVETEPYVTTPPFTVQLKNIYPQAEVTLELFNNDTNTLVEQIHFRPGQETMLFPFTTPPLGGLSLSDLPDGTYKLVLTEHLLPFNEVEVKATKVYTLENNIVIQGSVNSTN